MVVVVGGGAAKQEGESDELMLLHCSPFVHALHAPSPAVHALRCMHTSPVKHSGGRWEKRTLPF